MFNIFLPFKVCPFYSQSNKMYNWITLIVQFHCPTSLSFLFLTFQLLNKNTFKCCTPHSLIDWLILSNSNVYPCSDFRPGTCPRSWIMPRMTFPLPAVSMTLSRYRVCRRDRHTNRHLRPHRRRHSHKAAGTYPWTLGQDPAPPVHLPRQLRQESPCCKESSHSPGSLGTRAPPF